MLGTRAGTVTVERDAAERRPKGVQPRIEAAAASRIHRGSSALWFYHQTAFGQAWFCGQSAKHLAT